MKFLIFSVPLLLLSTLAQAEDRGFSYQSSDGTIYTSTTAPSWCKRYYEYNGPVLGGSMPQVCADPQFTTSRGSLKKARSRPDRDEEEDSGGIFGIFKRSTTSTPAGEDADDASGYKGKKDRQREARVPPAPSRGRARSRVKEKEIEVEITPVLEADDEKEGKGLVPPAPIPPAPKRRHGKTTDGEGAKGKMGEELEVRVPPAPGGSADFDPNANGDSDDDSGGRNGKGKKDLPRDARVPPGPKRQAIGTDDPATRVTIRGSEDPGKGKKGQVPGVRVPPAPRQAKGGSGKGAGSPGKGKQDQERDAVVPPAPGSGDLFGNGDDANDDSDFGDGGMKGKKDRPRAVDVPPAPSGDYGEKGKKGDQRTARVPPAPAKKEESFLKDWGVNVEELRQRLQPIRIVQPSGKVTVTGGSGHKPVKVNPDPSSCVDGQAPAEVLPIAPWVKDVQRITAERNPAASNKGEPDLLAAVRKRTPEQEKCAAEAPKSPSRVVLAFDAFGSFDYLGYYKEKNAQLPEKEAEAFRKGNAITDAARKEDRSAPGVHWKYYSKEILEKDVLTPAARCAFELATKPYKNKDGKTVYNTISLVGHSFGGDSAQRVAKALKRLGLRVDLVLTTDPRQSLSLMNRVTFVRPTSVDRWVNFYQVNDPILKGFPVDGAENVDISDSGAWHGQAPHAPQVRARASQEVMGLPRCKSDLTTSVYKQSKVNCD